jgi:hypothetical protein
VLTKIYFSIWAIVGIAAAIMFLTGNMTMLVLVVFGFIGFGLVFMGMMGVLPIEASRMSQKPHVELKPIKENVKPGNVAVTVGDAVASYFDPGNVIVHRHRHP